MGNFVIVDHPLVKKDITILRNKDTKTEQFRMAFRRVAALLAFEACKNFKLNEVDVETPLEKTIGYELGEDIILLPILRAGLSMVTPFLEIVPDAKVGHIGIQRNEETLEPMEYYFKAPSTVPESRILILDPMLATGGSASTAISFLKKRGAKTISLVCVVAAPEGIKRISKDHPDVNIYAATLDRELNDKGYILPGLGDAGDRAFGTF
ncbi:MAG TPA: uracil phosphoribosyltransferase [Ignavibacteriales bacterium]|nr:uracil phosphoribosyltransferase [Ignavibacteriales bacterium]HOL81385.1 uracil phosphoribosyltransferase [Ignavibacteriales bacterium]HOM65500.1 uracil phosphoribosyltransferase [Ignavibacteriales bacterium]HPD67745.1 uracil phosphoribosyltransferase [Ignavibacteriales bacterium]HPP33846.1 uracil phosphoribosyltransferase [Ignavibacteriales bacterium]